MALWDNSTHVTKCPSCGSNIFFDVNFQKLACKSCGSFFAPNTLDYSFQLKVMDKEVATEDDSRNEFFCDSCGAVVVTDDTTSATCCAFCGSPTMISRRLANDFRPDVIIPFKFGIEEAKKKFYDWARNFKRAPRSFRSLGTINQIRGVYVPFWLIDAVCHLDYVDGYDSVAKDFTLRRVPFDGAKKIPNILMEAIEPYDYSELVPYNDGYIHGYAAQRYDISAVEMTERIGHRLNEYVHKVYDKMHKARLYGYDSGDFSYVGDMSQQYALLPVYTLNYEYNGKNYQYCINGQTGEVQGIEVPHSKIYNIGKYIRNGLILAGAGIAIIGIIFGLLYLIFKVLQMSSFLNGYVLARQLREEVFYFISFAVIAGVTIAYTLIKRITNKVGDFFFVENDKYQLIEEKPDVTEYFDTSSVRDPKKIKRADEV